MSILKNIPKLSIATIMFKYEANDDDIVRNGCFALASEHYKIVTDQYFRSLSHHQANAIFTAFNV
ncbi:hypothetical protein T07_13578 [Trichinella nelsoni]|uniref:Uncharacterized protein n=1 Tax=Trichinella nelsoni TaxID=6336 RepID=A0A0V0RIT5_9BILA|nr:hypothetical protein T07_13578 [Trichinella nelsoni]